MERKLAMIELGKLVGTDLCKLAKQMDIPVQVNGRTNKGWAGHTLERYLGLPLNSAQAPNFGSWELKLASLKRNSDGVIKVKETIAITMIDPVEVASKPFAESHLYRKLCKAVVVGRVWESAAEAQSLVHSIASFDLDHPRILHQVKRDYELVREIFRAGGSIDDLSGKMGVLVQPRTKGPGRTVTRTRAFYARTGFVAHILNITPLKMEGLVEPEEDPEA